MFLLIGAGTVYDQRSPPMSPNVISTRRLSARRLAAERLPRRRQLRPAKVEGAQGTHGEQPSVHAVRTAVRQHGSTAVRQRGLHRRHLPHLPRHRSHPQGKLYVCLSMGLCLVICCLILYFLFPRTVVLVPVFVQSVTVYFTPEAVSLEVTNLVNISNENFFPVQIVELDIQGLILKTIMGKSKQCNVTRLDARSQLLYNMKLVLSIEDKGLKTYCQSKAIPLHTLFLELQITMQVSYLSHNEQFFMNIYEYIDCGNNSTVPHLPA
ncbi:transmembrane protein 106A isoform X7 [Gadus macrocephalus]|uniref:transmembrane protein 106A isoform X7 n=1 Tax=Gadus macrocephalus TaxID=80720 RepID=UPI0028CB7FE9|nr:transmembrane protein 106A isoform X7 [Gadus macrocephalus]